MYKLGRSLLEGGFYLRKYGITSGVLTHLMHSLAGNILLDVKLRQFCMPSSLKHDFPSAGNHDRGMHSGAVLSHLLMRDALLHLS